MSLDYNLFEKVIQFSSEKLPEDDKAKLFNRLTEDSTLGNNVINVFSKIQDDNLRINYLKSFLTKKESLTSSTAELQLQDRGIWVLYGEEYTFLDQKLLEGFKVSNMKDLKMAIKTVLKLSGNDVITINSGSETLEDSESFSVAGLFNAKDNALEIKVEEIVSLTSNIAELQLQDRGIWVLYGEEYTFLDQKLLEGLKVSNMKDLKMAIKTVLKLSGNDVITINSGSETLEDSESFSVAGLFNAKDNALEIKVEEIVNLTSNIAELQLQDRGIWVLYGEEYTFLDQKLLEGLKVSNMKDLKMAIKTVLKLSENDVITINSGSETLEDSESFSVAGLFNAKDNALKIKIEDNEKVGQATIELNHIEEAFQIEYQGTALETFYLRLKQFYDEWYRQLKTYAPYLTIIQNSGSGKTRLVGELRTKGIYILYICKRHEKDPGYPDSTPYSQEIFKAIQDRKFDALLSVAIKQIKIKDWSAEEFWNIQVRDKNECNDFWKSVFESLSQQESSLSDYKNENFVKKLFPDTEIPVVCCFDEAHGLLTKAGNEETYFVRWRRQIRKIKWHGFFNILLSTNGKLGNFLPPVTRDTSSARSHDFEIFPAFLDVHTMDVLASLSDKNTNDYDYKRTVYLGLPLWGSLSQTGVDLADILNLASKKIRNFSKSNNDYLANLACIACSLALEVSPRIAEVDSLIASHMATAIGASLDRTSILCTYPSDTILASGALHGIINVGWENCLDTLLELLSRGVVEAGERGELVNRILFLKAYVDSRDDIPATCLQKVPLKLFLKSLLREKINDLDKLLEDMGIDEAEVGFNHWTSLLATNKDYVNAGGNKFLTEDLIIEAYHRHAAFKMPLGFPAIDHIIPFRYNAGYGIISIQNKNAKKTTFNNQDISPLIHPLNVFGKWKEDYKILGIYIDLGLDREKLVEAKAVLKSKGVPRTRSKSKDDTKTDQEYIIYIQGIEAFKCDDEIKKRLTKILFTRPWPLDAQWSMFDKDKNLERTNAIKSFLPLAFKQKQSLVDKWQLNTQQL